MSVDAVLKSLDENEEAMESYVLVRELKVLLDIDHEHFHPTVRIKIYRSNALPSQPFHFQVSHLVHTPDQASPYLTSRSFAETEVDAIDRAISTTTSFLKTAIRNGHEPSGDWLVKNEGF